MRFLIPEEDVELIKESYPSLCYSCKNSRRVVNQEKGYVGCTIPMKHYETFHIADVTAENVGRGMIDLHSRPFKMASSTGTANQLITRCVTACKKYNK